MLAAASQAGAASSDGPRAWLERTDRALATRNYRGVFVHEHGGESETLRVVHRVDAEGVSERLLSMDGSGREFIRKGSRLICYLPDRRTVLVERSPEAGLLLAGLPRVETASIEQYDVQEVAHSRVSSRRVRVIAITPRDAMRYGYRLWIDEATAMPLKTQLRSTQGEVLEQIVFTDLVMPSHIADSELQPQVDARRFRWVQQEGDGAGSQAPSLSVSWQENALPAGFRMTASARQMLPGGPVEHLVFSDGLASVSVFVEVRRDAKGSPSSEDAATLGISSAYSTVVQGYRVTAVGEVPPDTVRTIARSIRTAGPDTAAGEAPAIGAPLAPSLPQFINGTAIGPADTASALFGGGPSVESAVRAGAPAPPRGH
jgi:sigma-E factor negative regulatory protein RseB